VRRERALAALLLGLAAHPAGADEDGLVGPAKVRGPDTLVIAGARVKLAGVLPPEDAARCGPVACAEAAVAALAEVVGEGPVSCAKERRLGHGYFLGHCRTTAGADPAEALLARGLLQPGPGDGASERYATAAAAAKEARLGLWGG
jgi:endonuclease YncB( thermonuclease family)